MTFSLLLRVKGEGGTSERGHKVNGKQYRVTLGEYPATSLQAARALASTYLDQARRGVNPAKALEAAATRGGLTVEGLTEAFTAEYLDVRGLRAARKYLSAIETHIVPRLGGKLVDQLTREDVRTEMIAVMKKMPRNADDPRSRPQGGVEAARTFVSVLRQVINWGIKEEKLTRETNPAEDMEGNLPKKKRGERVLSLQESKEAWRGGADLGYPFGPVYQLNLLSANRRGEWSKCRREWIDLEQALVVIPAASYKSDHVHVVPLLPEAVEILRWVLAHHPQKGPYIFSGTEGEKPISGWSKAHGRMRDAIYANTGAFPQRWTPHDIRRTVATRVAEATGEEGDKLVKRVLGHSDKSVTAIYNRYAYVKEVRRVLADWAKELLAGETMTYVGDTLEVEWRGKRMTPEAHESPGLEIAGRLR